MHSLENIHDLIKIRISELDLLKKPTELYEPIHYTLNLGGKRLRPALCILACDLFNGNVQNAIDPAIGIEIFHNFTLIHDDIMDQAPIRRGKVTVYKKWNLNTAILSGDTMMALAYQSLLKTPEKVRNEVLTIFNKTAIEVCEGQQYDMNFETQTSVTIPDYITMIRLKTAVLLAASLQIGSLIGGAAFQEADQLYRFGENIGIAFQLKDDLLDAYGEEEKFGKMRGGDIISNKKTYLTLKAFELANDKNLKELQYLFSPDMIHPDKKVNGILRIYDEFNIRQLAENEILKYYQKALIYLENINIEAERKVVLKSIADQLNTRKF
jgi:geranylgeranyl diphosphate synthase type II